MNLVNPIIHVFQAIIFIHPSIHPFDHVCHSSIHSFTQSFNNDVFLYSRLVYDSQTKEYHNAEGVDIRIPCFGETHSVEYLDNHCIVHYFHSFVKYFTKLGYESGKDIRAAPYDWRFAPGMYNIIRIYMNNMTASKVNYNSYSKHIYVFPKCNDTSDL